ncbi:phosphonate ABC transporter, permease protein PhnE [Mariprofundus sp. EBB-1]|uniref:phosphonate ABC transporter, permease protein PhnE n=1 Tax=Mariprofundus sp. EBB-1 TaxID=2650971 RepID=UPI000EF22A06|nr:phosphonate ABC transporter, permease protein PhnE [Mariprofundus sp. EBB-1]RLL52721.1 phosphonate ABC transporter, permease protein PhnE [Mariprofundus sp. EBB-1]
MQKWHWPTPNGLPPFHISIVVICSILLLALSASMVEISYNRIVNGWRPMVDFLGHLLVTPDWSYLGQLGAKMLETVEMTVLATAIATIVSVPVGILAAENASPHPFVYRIMREVLSFARALPELVWALVFVSAVGLGPLPGVMALAFVTVGFMAKFIAESIEVVGKGAVEGIQSTGGGRLQTIMFAIMPQALPDFAGTLLYILDHNLRAAAILGLVGAGGIGYDMVISMRMFEYDRIIMIAISIYLIVTLLDRLSDKLRKRIIHGKVNVIR